MVKMSEFDCLSIYLDESGSSGKNFFDLQPPYYVLAGLIMQTSAEKDVVDVFNRWEKKYLKKQQIEIKGKNLFKSYKGFQKFEELMKDVNQFIMSPVYGFVDKRYALCFISIEAFLDSGYNPSVTNNEFFWEDNKKLWVNLFYEKVTDVALKKLNDVILKHNRTTFCDAKNLLIKNLNDAGELELANKIKNCPDEDAFSFLTQKDELELNLNSIVFNALLFSINNALFFNPPKVLKIIHDEQYCYQKNFEYYTELITKGKLRRFETGKDLSTTWGSGGKCNISFEQSCNNSIIKLADLITSFTQVTLQDVILNGQNTKASMGLFRLFWTPILRHFMPTFKDIPPWFYEGIPISAQMKLVNSLFDKA